MLLKNTIIYLIGFAGVGKLTIAKELAKLDKFRIVDNHLINDPIFNVITIEEGHIQMGVWAQVRKVRAAVYETIENYAHKDTNFIFTNQLFEGNEGDLAIYKRVKKLAKARNSNFFPVRLLVAEEEHKKRITSHERKNSFKASSLEYIDKIYGLEILKIKGKNKIDIDTTKLSAKQTAEYIFNIICNKKGLK